MPLQHHRAACALAVLALLATVDAQSFPRWDRIPSGSARVIARANHMVVTNSTHAMIVGGETTDSTYPETSIAYEFGTRVIMEQPLPRLFGQSGPTTYQINRAAWAQVPGTTRSWLFSGREPTGNYVFGLQEYDASTNTFRRVPSRPNTQADPPGRELASGAWLSKCYRNATSGLIEPCFCFFGGLRGTAGSAVQVWQATATGFSNQDGIVWRVQTIPSSPTARWSTIAGVSAAGDVLYLIGGDTATGSVNDVWAYAPFGFSDVRAGEYSNVARPTVNTAVRVWQSSTRPGTPSGVATNAVDGNPDTNFNNNRCTHTETSTFNQTNPWWAIDLGSVMTIDNLRIFQRTDCCRGRMAGYEVYIANGPFALNAAPPFGQPGVTKLRTPSADITGIFGDVPDIRGRSFRYLWVYLPGPGRFLSICELELWRRNTDVWRQLSGSYNAALLKPAFASTKDNNAEENQFAGGAELGNNGLTEGNTDWVKTSTATWRPGSPAPRIFWYTDLQSVHDISTIEIFPRGSNVNPQRRTRYELYVGNSARFEGCTRCWGPSDQLVGVVNNVAITINCPSRGRYVHLRRVPAFNETAGDSNVLEFGEVRVNANRLTNQPAPRSGAAYAVWGGYIVMFGGRDRNGVQLNDVRLFDTLDGVWLPPITIFGTPPRARSFASLTIIPPMNPSTNFYAEPSNSLLLFGGVGQESALGDFATLTFAKCPPLQDPYFASLTCSHGDTVCYYTCSVGTHMNGDRPLRCGLDGAWIGITPYCLAPVLQSPMITQVFPPVAGVGNATVTWRAVVSTNPATPVLKYKVTARTNVYVQQFTNVGFLDSTDWTVLPTYPLTAAHVYGFADRAFWINAEAGRDCWGAAQNCFGIYRPFPPQLGSSNSSWAMESYVSFAIGSTYVPLDGNQNGIAVFDIGERLRTPVNTTFTGCAELFAGIRRASGVYQVGWEASCSQGMAYWVTDARATAAWVRIERIWSRDPALRGWRMGYKFDSRDAWAFTYIRFDSILARTGTEEFLPESRLRVGFLAKNGQALRIRSYAEYQYLRIGPPECSDTGPEVEVPQPAGATVSTDVRAMVPGLDGGQTYRFAIQSWNGVTWSSTVDPNPSLSRPISAPVVVIPATRQPINLGSLVMVSRNKPTTQSSTLAASSFAVDGNYGSLQHTNQGLVSGEWLQIDLGQQVSVKALTVYNRQPDGPCQLCAARYTGTEVFVSPTPAFSDSPTCADAPYNITNGADGASWRWNATINALQIAAPVSASAPEGWRPYNPSIDFVATFECPLVGRYVTLRASPTAGIYGIDGFLHVREVEVFAANSCPFRNATLADTVAGSVCTGARLGAVCAHRCLPGYVAVSGEATSTCDGENWDQPELVCAPECPALPAPEYTETCMRSLFAENFNLLNVTGVTAVQNRWYSFFPNTQGFDDKWFVMNSGFEGDGKMFASANVGCDDHLYAGIADAKVTGHREAFVFSAEVTTGDRAGLFFRSIDRQNMYRVVCDLLINLCSLQVVLANQVTLLNSAQVSDQVLQPNRPFRLGVAMSGPNITVSLNGAYLFDSLILDRTLLAGAAGLYAATNASFDDVEFNAPCIGSVTGATNANTAEFTCQTGLTAIGPLKRTCRVNADGLTADWVPDVVNQTTRCTLGNPIMVPQTLFVRENSIRNALVGNPITASIESPDFQLQYKIDNCVTVPAGRCNAASPFYIDACSGQVKVRNPVLDFEAQATYTLTIRAYVLEFPLTSFATLNYLVQLINEDEAPVINPTDFILPENSVGGTNVGTIPFFDPENNTVFLTLDVVSPGGRFYDIDTATGAIRVRPGVTSGQLNFELAETSSVDFVISARQFNSSLASSAKITIRLTDQNDAPAIPSGQILLIDEVNTTARPAVFPAKVVATDEDANSGLPALALLPPASCGIAARFATVDGTAGGASLFTLGSDGTLTLTTLPAAGAFNTIAEYQALGTLVHADYELCVNASDATSWTIGRVSVGIRAQTPTIPVLLSLRTGSTMVSTVGGDIHEFDGSGFGFSTSATITAFYSNALRNYTCTCRAVSDTILRCTTVPGIGANYRYTVRVGTRTAVDVADFVWSYAGPSVTSVRNNTGLMTLGGQQVNFIGTGFGPAGTNVIVTYGPPGNEGRFTCSHQQIPATAQTRVACTTAPGAGQNLMWRISVGEQSVMASGSDNSQWIGYAAPVITSVAPAVPGVDIRSLSTRGGQAILISGSNFGPANAGLQLSVQYGGPSGTVLNFANCLQGTGDSAHSNVTCLTVPGVGKDHKVMVTAEGVAALVAWPAAGAALAYTAPNITAVQGPDAMDTEGGAVFTVVGTSFGPAAWFENPLVTYGKPGDTGRYTATSCQVTTPVGAQFDTMRCVSAPGVGRNHFVILIVGAQSSSAFASRLGYASPMIYFFTGMGSDNADTRGGDSVVLNGKNFGPSDAYTQALMNVTYGVEIRTAPATGPTVTNLLFTPTACVHQTAHTEVVCTVAPGAGADLNWRMVLDGIESRNPATNYHEPVITDIVYESNGQPVTDADVDGGDLILVKGDFFGPQAFSQTGAPLIQSVTFGATGSEYTVPPSNWQLLAPGHSIIRVRLPPGAGTDLRFKVAVADQVSEASTVTFSYARIAVTAIIPNTANTFSDPRQPTVITVQARNVPLKDPQSRIELMFGNGPYAQRLPLVVPQGDAAIAAARNTDGTVNVSFTLPRDGAGVDLAVRLDIVPAAAPSGSPALLSSVVDWSTLFSYRPPVITDVILTLARFLPANATGSSAGSDAVRCDFPAGHLLWKCDDPNMLVLTVLGTNFGGDPARIARQDGVTRTAETVWYVDPVTSEVYWTTARLWPISYDHNRISFYIHSMYVPGSLKLSLASTAYDGSPRLQTVTTTFNQRSPDVGRVTGALTGIPTVGGSAVTIEVAELAGADDVEVTVGGTPASLFPTLADATANSNELATRASRASFITTRTNFLSSNPNEARIYFLYVRVPAGQGEGNPIVVYRVSTATNPPDKRASNDGVKLSYARPRVTGITLLLSGSAGPESAPNAEGITDVNSVSFRVVAPTDGSARVRIRGSDLGSAPSLLVGHAVTVATTQCAGSEGPLHRCVEAVLPAGEGTGLSAIFGEFGGGTVGYRLQLLAGNQPSGAYRFEYAPAVVTSITAPGGRLPTRGGVPISIHGTNFGVSAAINRITVGITIRFTDNSAGGALLDCVSPVRISHTMINCTLPEGSGKDLDALVVIADSVQARSARVLSYDAPIITSASISSNVTEVLAGRVHPVLRANSTGGDIITLTGANFGSNSTAHCAFLSWVNRRPAAGALRCDGKENFLGEGEVSSSAVVSWDHESVSFVVPPGLGHKQVQLSIRGSTLQAGPADAGALLFRYLAPVLLSAEPSLVDTEGGELLTLVGYSLGPNPRNTSRTDLRLSSDVFTDQSGGGLSLDDAPGLPTAYLLIVFHRACVSAARDVRGVRPDFPVLPLWYGSTTLEGCSGAVSAITHDGATFASVPGIGRDRRLTVHVVDPVDGVVESSNAITLSYRPPSVESFSPSVVYMSAEQGNIDVLGRYFGNEELANAQGWTPEERALSATVGGFDCDQTRRRRENGETVLSCELDQRLLPAGYRNVTVRVAGQIGVRDASPSGRTLLLVCAPGFYGRVNETCLPCPAQSDDPSKRGANCRGYIPQVREFDARFTYPRPLKGWYNLNSTDMYTQRVEGNPSMMSACPEGFQDNGRDVCIVPCDPPDSCLGDNLCAEGYTSKPPMWRCASCDKGFYKRSGECIKCPDSPGALFIGFILLVIVVAGVGFALNRKQINIAVISIGVDFFQVLAIFAQARIKWPPVVKELLHVLSAFNLNIEIVAPECLIPDVSYKQKFWFIMLLPLCIGGLFAANYAGLVAYKALILGQPKKMWHTHSPALVSSGLVLLYLLYLYLTRTIMDVFTCSPVSPPDGYTYLSVVFERCGVPGGTQLTLLPYAIAGLVVYTAGYPFFIGYTLFRNREIVMEDQLLRAKGTGNDKLSNPRAFDFRLTFGRSYFQFKPDWCMWILAIILRKFFIAITAVVFGKNSSFQMAACLLIMFLAYAAQVQIRPYMSPGDFDEVLKSHTEASYTSAIHARLRASIAGIESRGRKKGHKNLINFEGKVDRAAVLGVLTGFFFNYNTVEAIMTFCAVIVCLMAIMYQANELNSYYPESKDSVTSVVLIVIIWAIIYFFTVFATEIVVLYNEDNRAKQLAKAAKAKGGKKAAGDDESSSKDGPRKGKLMDEDGEMNLGKVEQATNPLFLRQDKGKDGGASSGMGAGSTASSSIVESILAQREAPPTDLWRVFQDTFAAQHEQIKALQGQNQELKKAAQTGGRGSLMMDVPASSGPNKTKREFNPSATGGIDAAGGSNPIRAARSVSGASTGSAGGFSMAATRKSAARSTTTAASDA